MPNARLGDLTENQITKLLKAGQLEIDLGPMRVAIRSEVPDLTRALSLVYGQYPICGPSPFVDIRVALLRGQGLRSAVRPQIRFFVDGNFPFEPFPASNHLPFVEWGMNWTIAHRSNVHLLLHAGVVEKNGHGIVLSALPGSGKSTLTAAFVASGFRLFSDEFGVLRLSDHTLIPLLRPIALKNDSITVIRNFSRDIVMGPVFHGTRKGDVAHVAPNAESVTRRSEPVKPRLILFPKFVPGAATTLEPEQPSRAFSRLSVNSFNYELLGPVSFQALAELVKGCPAYRLQYSDLDSAITAVNQLVS